MNLLLALMAQTDTKEQVHESMDQLAETLVDKLSDRALALKRWPLLHADLDDTTLRKSSYHPLPSSMKSPISALPSLPAQFATPLSASLRSPLPLTHPCHNPGDSSLPWTRHHPTLRMQAAASGDGDEEEQDKEEGEAKGKGKKKRKTKAKDASKGTGKRRRKREKIVEEGTLEWWTVEGYSRGDATASGLTGKKKKGYGVYG